MSSTTTSLPPVSSTGGATSSCGHSHPVMLWVMSGKEGFIGDDEGSSGVYGFNTHRYVFTSVDGIPSIKHIKTHEDFQAVKESLKTASNCGGCPPATVTQAHIKVLFDKYYKSEHPTERFVFVETTGKGYWELDANTSRDTELKKLAERREFVDQWYKNQTKFTPEQLKEKMETLETVKHRHATTDSINSALVTTLNELVKKDYHEFAVPGKHHSWTYQDNENNPHDLFLLIGKLNSEVLERVDEDYPAPPNGTASSLDTEDDETVGNEKDDLEWSDVTRVRDEASNQLGAGNQEVGDWEII